MSDRPSTAVEILTPLMPLVVSNVFFAFDSLPTGVRG